MNTATAAAVGTSLEVLAPYLPYKIEVENIRQNGFTKQGTRHLLVGLDCTDDFPIKAGSMCYKPEGVLPVLRDFSQLTVPLPTGEVPARRIAEMALEVPDWLDQPELDWSKLTAVVDEDDQGLEHLIITVPEVERLAEPIMLYMWMDGTVHVHNGPHGNQLAIFDQMRAWHFALPVNGRPLVANVDFIPFTAPSTPTREADNNPTL